MRRGPFPCVFDPLIPGSIRAFALLCAKLLPHEKCGTAADERGSRGPVVQTQNNSSHNRRDTGDLRDFPDENQSCVCHFDSSAALARRIRSISFRPRHIGHDLLGLFFRGGRALVAHVREPLGGALLDFYVFGFEQAVPDAK